MPGNTGSVQLFYARVTDIVIGVLVVLAFDLMFPWCAGHCLLAVVAPAGHES